MGSSERGRKICSASGKVCFAPVGQARSIFRGGASFRARIYFCPDCNYYHNTNAEKISSAKQDYRTGSQMRRDSKVWRAQKAADARAAKRRKATR